MRRSSVFSCGLVAAVLVATLPACRREQRRFSEDSYMNGGVLGARIDEATPLGVPQAGAGPYKGNAWAMSEGYRLYNQMNCVGCHANGGGGMGPSLMDGKWRYGSEAGDVFQTIVEGRPNGMPSFKGRMSDQQVWQLVAYVRSLSGLQPMDAAPSRPDHMAVKPPNNRMKKQPMEKEEAK